MSGTIVTDDVILAGLPLPAHTFGASNVESDDVSWPLSLLSCCGLTDNVSQFGGKDAITDGLMGLAQGTLSNQGVLTPVEALAKAGGIKASITSFKISRLADQKNDGEVTIGGLDETKFDPATLATLPNVNKAGFWEGAMDAVTVDGKDTGLAGRTAILDTVSSQNSMFESLSPYKFPDYHFHLLTRAQLLSSLPLLMLLLSTS